MSDIRAGDGRMGEGQVACQDLQEVYELYALGALEEADVLVVRERAL